MAEKPVAQKLLIKPDSRVWSTHPDRVDLLGPLPEGARTVQDPNSASVALLFADDEASLREALDANHEHLCRHDVLWVAYPKGNRADINRDSLWPIVAEHGLRPVAQVAMTEVWSALRFRPLREGEAQFSGGKA